MRVDCGRTVEEFMERVERRSAAEDKVAQIWADNHNKIGKNSKTANDVRCFQRAWIFQFSEG